MPTNVELDRIVRDRECTELTGLSRSTRWRMAQRGEFPAPVRLSAMAVGWRLSDLQRWIKERTACAA